jgi:calcineurin-like phosphoesterase
MLEIITISDAKDVGTNGLKAGIQVWKKKTKHRLVMDHVNFKQPSNCPLE